ncbi:hypothetical protein ACFVMC_23715 [Nocardia sp. NPDC127579]|uniref:hypothetical protein n=1 Tax=Nocardia sp. NPDC127579 TaxID=3345402 RepID=UPI00364213F2
MRVTITRSVALAALTAAAVGFGSGTAAALDPVVQPDQGRAGVRLSHGETEAVAAGPMPALITMFVPLTKIGAGLHPDTEIYRDQYGGVYASLRQVIAESAEHPDGTITFLFNAPGSRGGRVMDVYQHWTE